MPFVLRLVLFPSILVEKLGKAFNDVPKSGLRQGSKSNNFFCPLSSTQLGRFRVSFLASTRGPNLGRTIVFPLASQRDPQKANRPFQSDFKLFRIPPLPFRYANFHWFFHPVDWFLLPVFRKFQFGTTVNGKLNGQKTNP
ncbi:hypothetical protein AVEN_128481-1 [Araneus ventricosus]|uniref:Uncharacterized protein n=1 Tax=Araneus ventricosus TaxID=182803 RepID=A0A4Y2KTM2_ARAVE|nr:hypothetical protein AVEN_128481-1 [Araneus ventricosus]